MKERMLDYFKKVVIETSNLSTCVSKQVGALLIRDDRIIAIGYNGTPKDKKHCCEVFDKNNFIRDEHHAWSNKNELHAEQNLISFCAKNGIKTEGTELFLTISPCVHCAKLIIATGITNVYYIEEYDKESGLTLLLENNINCIKI